MIEIDTILHGWLDERIEEVKNDLSLVDKIFIGKTELERQEIKNWISGQKIRTVMHHPRDAGDLPCYCIVLESMAEAEQVIGSSGAEYDEVLISTMEDGWIGSDSLLMSGTETDAVGIRQFYSARETKDGRRSCHIVAKKGMSAGKGVWIDFKNSVLEGGSVSLSGMDSVVFWVKSNRTGNFMKFGFGKNAHGERKFGFDVGYKNAWQKVRIDVSGVSDADKSGLRFMNFEISDDSEDTDLYLDELKGERLSYGVVNEALFSNSYRIECWSNSADLTLMLYSFLWWNVLKWRQYFETNWGLLEQRIEGGDLMPQPEFYPEFVYVRGLTFTCKTIETVPREEGVADLEVKVGRMEMGGV